MARILITIAGVILVSVVGLAAFSKPSCACAPDVRTAEFIFDKPNFAGAWTMDRARSFGLPGNMNQTMTVTQKDDQIDIETKLMQPGNERTQKDTYILDGKEHDFTPPVPPNAPAGAPAPNFGAAKRVGRGVLQLSLRITAHSSGVARMQERRRSAADGD